MNSQEIENYFEKFGMTNVSEGQDLLGCRVKVGDKIIFPVHKNASIRWVKGTVVTIVYRDLIDDTVSDYRLVEESKKDKKEYYYHVHTDKNRHTKKCWNEIVKIPE